MLKNFIFKKLVLHLLRFRNSNQLNNEKGLY